MSARSKDMAEWLRTSRGADFPDLAEYALGKGWKAVFRLSDAWRLLDQDGTLSAAEKQSLKDAAALAFVRHREEQSSSIWSTFGAFGICVFIFMFLVVGILAGVIFEVVWYDDFYHDSEFRMPLLARLANADSARGLITFVFTIGVVSLALIIVTANVTTEDGDGKRFERSKEILMALIVILGTIMGFYFGKSDETSQAMIDRIENALDIRDRDSQRQEAGESAQTSGQQAEEPAGTLSPPG